MVKTPSYDRSNMRRGHWKDEDENMGRTSNWNVSPNKAGLKRCGKSCRLRSTNNPKDGDKNESFTTEEEELIIRLHQAIGSRWSIIAQQLQGRAENEVKNYWNTKLKKKLTEKGIDPVTHRPFSQLLADYGNMSGLPRHVAPNDRDFGNTFVFRTEQESFPNHDLLSQLQAITLVTEASKISNNEMNDCSSSSSTSSPSFSWRDFLVDDPFFPSDHEGKSGIDLELKDKHILEENGLKASSSLDCSFVEKMVERQNEMVLDFPELLEDTFFY